jgi:hypothetical protein
MSAPPYTLILAVQDLYDLYLRLAPAGPYRMELFHDRQEPGAGWPDGLRGSARRLELLVRGVSCLLANQLAPASFALTGRLLSEVRALHRELDGMQTEPEYYRYLDFEVQQAEALDATLAYRLFGEVLSLYLDLLCVYGPPEAGDHLTRISQLRSALA